MFWRFEMRTASHIDALLEKEDVTLQEILEEDDVLQECKAQNKKLIDFLAKESVVEELVELITKEPPSDIEDSIQYKHPNMACELLTADITPITDKLADTESIFNKLWSFLDTKAPLNPLLASFFSKTVGSLLARRPELVIDHIKKQEDCLGIFFKHLQTSAIMDLILRLITCIDSQELRTPFLEWLNEKRFIQRLVDLIDPEQSEEVHSNTAQTVCDIIRLTREHMSQLQECAESDPLLTTIETQDTVTELLEHMFRGKRAESALVNGVSVLLSLLEFKKQSDTFLFPSPEGQEQMTPLDAERLAKGVSGTLKAIVPKLSELHQILEEPPTQGSMVTTVGKLDPPFGFARLQVCKLISALLVTNTPAINSELASLGTINTIWELFFKYMWNNFLHLEVEKSLATILTNNAAEFDEEGKLQHPLLVHLFNECKLVQRILEMWEANDTSQQQGGRRHGYMGHLTRIANCLAQELEKGCNSERIKSLMEEYVPQEDRDRWTNFVSGGLAEMNKRNIVDMVGTNAFHSSSDDEDPDFRDIDFGKDTALQQAFSDYQMQQMTSHFIDQFGFTEEEFTEQDQGVNNPFDRISDINFSISANEDNPNSALFEACCNEKISSFQYNNSDDEDMWEEKEFTFTAGESDSKPRERSGGGKEDNDDGDQSSDSDEAQGEEEFPPVHRPKPLPPGDDIRMDVDQGENWVASFDDIPMDSSVPMDSTPVAWELPPTTTTTVTTGNDGWANFDSFNAGVFPTRGDNAAPRSSSPMEMESAPSQQQVSSAPSTPTSHVVASSTPPAQVRPDQQTTSTTPSDSDSSKDSSSPPVQDRVPSQTAGGEQSLMEEDKEVATPSPPSNAGASTSPVEANDPSGNSQDATSSNKGSNNCLDESPQSNHSTTSPQSDDISSGQSEEVSETEKMVVEETVTENHRNMHVDARTVGDPALDASTDASKVEEEKAGMSPVVKTEEGNKSSGSPRETHSSSLKIDLKSSVVVSLPEEINSLAGKQTMPLPPSPLTVKPNGPGFDAIKCEEKLNSAEGSVKTEEPTQNGPV